MKKLLVLALALVLALSITACGNKADTAAEEEVTLTAATGLIETHQFYMALEWMQEYLDSVDSTVTLDIYGNAELGAENELIGSVIANDGSVDLISCSDTPIGNYIPNIVFANFPGLHKDYSTVESDLLAEDGWIAEEIDKIMEENGLVRLGFMENDFSWVTNNKRPVESLADAKGLKLRVPEVEIFVDFWEEVGAIPCVVALPDLVTSLQTGVVDGAELGINAFFPYGVQDYNQYMTKLNYLYKSGFIMMNDAVYSALSEQQQKDLYEAAQYAQGKTYEFTEEQQAERYAYMEENGNQIIENNDDLYNECRAIGNKLAHTDKWMKVLGEDLVNTMYPEGAN